MAEQTAAAEPAEQPAAEKAAQSTEQPRNPFQEAPHRKKMITLIGVYVCVVGSLIQSSSLSTLLPVAAGEIGGMSIYPLVNTFTGVVSIVCMPLWGYLGARFPHKKRLLFSVSLIVGAATVLLRAFAPNMWFIVVPAAFYGIVSAGTFVIGYSMIRDMFDRKQAGTYLGFCGTMMSVGLLAGPLLGGLIMDLAGWRWVCHLIWPIMTVGAVMVLFGVSARKEECAHLVNAKGRFDALGAVSIVLFLGTLCTAVSLGSSYIPFGSVPSIVLFILAGIGLILLIYDIHAKQEKAFVPAPALKNRNSLALCGIAFFNNFSNMAVFFFLPTYIIVAMQHTAVESGLVMACYSVCGLFLGPIFGKWIGKAGTVRGVATIGCCVRILVAAGILFVIAPDANIFALYVLMLIAGVYNSANATTNSAGPQIMLPQSIRMQGNSLTQVGQNLGSTIATAVYTVVLTSLGVTGGMPVALIIAIVAAALALLCAQFVRKLGDGDEGAPAPAAAASGK